MRSSASPSSLPYFSFAHQLPPPDNCRNHISLSHEPQLQENIQSPSANIRGITEDPAPEYGSIGGHDLPRALSTSTPDHLLSPALSQTVASDGNDSHLHSIPTSSISSSHSPHFASLFPSGRLTASSSHSGIAHYHYAEDNVFMANNSSQPFAPPSTSTSRRSRHGIPATRHPLMRVDTSSTSCSGQQRQPSPSRRPLSSQRQTHNSESASQGSSGSRYLIPQLNLSGRELYEGTPFPTQSSSTTFTYLHQEENERAGGSSTHSESRPSINNRGRLQPSALLPVEGSQWPAIARLPHGSESSERLGSSPSQIAIEINTPMGTRRPLAGKKTV